MVIHPAERASHSFFESIPKRGLNGGLAFQATLNSLYCAID
jgi:hypothetical protein